MKTSPFKVFAILLLLTGCGDVEHDLHKFKLYEFAEGTILTFQSDASTEEFVVQKIVNGRYEDSRSGTCEKPRLDIYDFQAVHLRPLDTLDRQFTFVSTLYTDCSGFPGTTLLRDPALVSSFVGTYQAESFDMIQWLDEFKAPISSFSMQHPRLTLQQKQFENVFEYDVADGKRLAKIFYTMRHGFVGYVLKSGEVFALTNNLP